MTQTQIDPNIKREVVGYVLNTGFSESAQKEIVYIQNKLQEKFPGSFWFPSSEALHITLLDWLTPVATYSEDKEDLYKQYKSSYIAALEEVTHNQHPISIHFNQIKASSSAVFIQGNDDGSYQHIRDSFLKRVSLVSGTKLPPQIIHSSIARCLKEIDLEEVIHFLSTLSMDFVQTVNEFRLVRESKIPMQDFQVLQSFYLKSSNITSI